MAIWQYDLFCIGKGDARPFLTDDGLDIPPLLAASTLRAQRALVNSMGYPWLMMDDWVVFGSEQDTRIDLMFNEADEVEIRIRLSASASEADLDAICGFARELDCKLFDPTTGELLQPDRSLVSSALVASRAAAFSRFPRSLLSGQSEA